ncbi:alpha/beta fold hydrolase [Dyadobacter subterraneus]|nr:alpha/beta hydrolase [Dyadobacter subterraneus]
MKRNEFLKLGTIATAGLALLPKSNLIASVPSKIMAKTVPTSYVLVDGVKFAYRRYGKKVGIPMVFTNYLTGTMDNWDPAIIDSLALNREVIIFDNRGVASSEGKTPDTIAAMAKDAAAFIDTLGLHKIDLFGFSIGGMVAQQLTIDRPELIRKLILIGTGPRGGERMADYSTHVWSLFKKQYPHPDELLLDTFFTPTAKSQKAGWAYLTRIRSRPDKEPALTDQVVPAQLSAIFAWGKLQEHSFDYLKGIRQPTLIIHGDQDIICPAINAVTLKENLPNASLIIFPDANHAPHFQYPELFLSQIKQFMTGV